MAAVTWNHENALATPAATSRSALRVAACKSEAVHQLTCSRRFTGSYR